MCLKQLIKDYKTHHEWKAITFEYFKRDFYEPK